MKYIKAVYVTSHDIKSDLNRNYDVYTNTLNKNEEVYLATINYASKDFACQYNSNRDNPHHIKGDLNHQYDVFTNRVVQNENDYLATNYAGKNFACQYDNNRDTVICTCKRTKREGYKYFNTSRQVYRSQRYTSARGFTDVGVGNAKTVPKKRVRRIYLPDIEDRGVGSSDLTSFIRKTENGPTSYYDQKKTSSKCVGCVMEYNIHVLSEKLSPICKTKSGSTSPKRTSFDEKKNIDNHCIIPDPIVNIVMGRKHARGDKINKEQGTTLPQETLVKTTQVDQRNEISVPNTSKWQSKLAAAVNDVKDFSSDSLVQHVHNLENPSSFKHSKASIDLMIENKLEREYIKMFSQISKQGKPIAEVHPVQDCTSASLRRRFEALRRGLSKKEGSVEHSIVIKSSSQNSTLSKKDVSITSDPPSLEARSYTDAKIYSPVPSPLNKFNEDVPQTSHRRSVTGKERSSNWSTYAVDSDCQDVKGMFKLWGKKFDFEENGFNKTSAYTTPEANTKQKKKVELIIPKEEVMETHKKEGKKFSFFKRKNKEKAKQPYKSKKGVTAGRCEVGDGLMIRIGAANEFTPEPTKTKTELIPDDYDGMSRKAWLKRCLDSKNDSRNSVKIRWNNEMYATSSSTVFELMECVYKNTGILFTSRSEMSTTTVPTTTTVEFPYYQAKNQQINFMQQTIQAWMITKMMTDKSIEIQKPKNKNDIEVSFSDQKWFIDKSKAFSQKIELVLHSKNVVKDDATKSSEYIIIDIPKGYFLENSSEDEQSQSSDEQVFNIVEYETAKSSSYYLNKQKNYRKMDTGDYENDIRVIVNVNQNEDKETNVLEKEITPLLHRDVVVQGSNVYVPKRCDVISVGIITQHTHNRDIQKTILRMQDEMTDDESRHKILPQKKCELAEHYLQDYYRHWVPLGMDLYSWCVSDSNLRAASDNNSMNSFNNQCDGSKSCPNIYDDYQASAIVSSCTTSSRSQCMIIEDSKGDDTTSTYFNKLKKDEPQLAAAKIKRVLPKDSVEVFKRRKIYAASKVNADWCTNQGLEPLSKPSIFDKFAQKLSNESTCDHSNQNKKKIKKHVSLKDLKKIGESIISFKGVQRCNKCNTPAPCSKHALVMPEPRCQMLPPPCLDTCTKKKKPPCLKEAPANCLIPPPPICPEGPPSPCQPACPPIPPPCASYLGGSSTSHPTMPPSSQSRSISRFLPSRKKCSPSSPQKPPSPPPQKSPPQLLPTAPPTTKLSRFLSRCSKHKAPCTDSCLKQEKPPCSTKDSSPSSVSPRNSPPQSPRNSPYHLPPATSSKPRSFSRFFAGRSKQKPSCIDSCSKLKKPPCSTKDSSPCASLLETSPLSMHPSNPATHPKFTSQSSQQKTCQDSCSKLKKPPCFTKHSSPCLSSPPVSPPSPPCLAHPSNHCTPHRSKFSFSNSKQEIHCLESTEGTNKNNPPIKTKKARCGRTPHAEGLSSLSRSHLRPTKSTPLSPPTCLPPQSTLPCGCNSQKSCGLPTCLSIKRSPCPSQEFPFPPKNLLSPKTSGISLKKDPVGKKNSSTSKEESGDCDLDCPRKIKQKKKEGPIPSILQIPPQPFCQPSTPNPRSQSKMSGLHFRKLPMPRNLSNESQPSCKIIRLNSKENLSIRTKPKTPSTEAIREGCNIKVQDEDGQTLYERRDYKMDTAQARKHLVQDMYRDSRIHRVSTTNAEIMKEKNIQSCEVQSNTSLSNIVEINLNLKFKQIDKTTEVNIKKCSDTPNDDENEKLNNQASKDVYTLQDKIKQSIDRIEDVEKRDVNIKIIINNYQQSANKSKRKIIHENFQADEEFSRKISEKFHTVSTGYSDVLDQQTFSVHRATVNFTDSADTSKDIIKSSVELLNEELIEKGPINQTDNERKAKPSKSEPSVTSHTNKNEGSQLLTSDISQIKFSETNLENTFDTFDEKSATRLSATDNEEALHSDIQHSDLKLPSILNKEKRNKLLKLLFEDSSDRKKSPNRSKMKRIRKMLRAVLTSDSSAYEDDSINHEVAKELAYESMKPNFFKDSESMTNYYQIDSSISDNRSSMNEIEEILHPTEINNSLNSAESTCGAECLCSHLAAKLNLCENNNLQACCCRGNAKRDEEIDCNLIEDLKANKANYVDVETQDSNLKTKFKQPGFTIETNAVVIQPHKVKDKKRQVFSKMPKRLFSYSSSVKVCKLNRQTVLGLSDDDKVIILNSESAESKSQEVACMKSANLNPIDILQLYETKKAVLEIYAEKTVSHTEENLIAKLPKFIYKTESGNFNYEDMFSDFHEFSAEISF